MTPPDSRPLAGLRIVELSSFVAAPLCGLTLSQLGADVIRVDPLGGAADYRRWPVTADGESIYWTGLNRGKRSLACDLRSPDAQRLLQRLITAPGPAGGILVTNAAGRDWLGHETLARLRRDVITLEVLGRHDGGTAVDYTVNAGLGFPYLTGPVDHSGAVNHVLPAWDLACGLYAALSVTAAVRNRERTGEGAHITLPLEDVALATAGALGYLTEVQINGSGREASGNAVYGTYGIDFVTRDGARFMIVALTNRHFRDLVELTGTGETVVALAAALGADFGLEEHRYRHREVLTALFASWFRERGGDEVAAALAKTTILHERYATFSEVVAGGALERNPLFANLEQPRIGSYLAAALPAMFGGRHFDATPAPALGADTEALLTDLLDLPAAEVADLISGGVVAGPKE
ncbi:CoA transferase [Aldersonia sp. NBC_00410]|uniref:CoA transferase n=1 Tax=Aldersonia sp. NBC_00410 TaxID=2975954 RepID=UPI00224D80DA|nr:CoA transferase [Aldersonia sp. NBC_00410]MCX5043534.1 CoA transferase [Aldersonia sp. NBC_00410]